MLDEDVEALCQMSLCFLEAVELLREADDMWAFSLSNLTRSTWDCEWNVKRIEFLKRAADVCLMP